MELTKYLAAAAALGCAPGLVLGAPPTVPTMSTYTPDEVEFGLALEDLNNRALESTFARIRDGKAAGCTMDNVKVRREW